DIDSTYGDVISLTVGEPGSRSHVFTYSFGYRLDSSDDSNCPHHPGGVTSSTKVTEWTDEVNHGVPTRGVLGPENGSSRQEMRKR
ncbi:MAG: hypothetical protein DSY81_00750, partial [Bacillota bacterium]